MADTSAALHPTRAHERRSRSDAVVVASLAVLLGGGCGGATEPRERIRTYEVAEATVGCNSIGGPSVCLSVRTPPDTTWRVLFGVVEGFTHEPGYRYVLRVAERPIPNPPTDSPAVQYRLVAVVSRTRVAP
jgi:hypothetical protein